MKKYFFKNDAGQQGPFNLEELKDKGITADTPIWHEGMESWSTAAQVEELKEMITAPSAPAVEEVLTVAGTKAEEVTVTVAEPAPVVEAAPETAPAAPVTEVIAAKPVETAAPAATAATTTAPTVKAAPKKGSMAVTLVLSLLALGGTGYYVYQDMEKNKNPSSAIVTTDSTGTETTDDPAAEDMTTNNNTDTTATVTPDTAADTTSTTTTTTEPAVTTTSKDPGAVKKAEEENKKLLAAQAKKKEEEKKKLLAAEAKKKEEEKKKLLAAQAQAAKEMEMRNNWPRYVSIGSYKVEGDDKVKPFSFPVYNGYPVMVDKVTLRVDYLKKEKVVGTETLILMNIPAKGSLSATTAGNKKGKTANVYITGITSRQLHFCYPATGGKTGDPYYCN